MKSPSIYRNGIPFFHDKSKSEFQKDIYERYHDIVVKQSALHLVDEFWGEYPMKCILDFASEHYKEQMLKNILEIGCGVGRWIASIAQAYPKAVCWGIDYSYQMLKRANEHWVLGNAISIDYSHKGFTKTVELNGLQIPNLSFGLAKAANLPFSDNSQDIVLNSFLLDRLEDPIQCFKEMYRILKPNGTLIMITPLNFNNMDHWNMLHPPIKIQQVLTKIGLSILEWKEDMVVKESLDARGNYVHWNCLAVAARKTI